MANIQSSINQTISLAGLLATQTPAFKAAAEKRAQLKDIEKRENIHKEAYKTHRENVAERRAEWEAIKQKGEPTAIQKDARLAEVAAFEEESARLEEEASKLIKEKYRINPTKETYEEYIGDKVYEEFEALEERGLAEERAAEKEKELAAITREEQARAAADAKLARAAAEKRETRRRILEGTPSEYILRQEDKE